MGVLQKSLDKGVEVLEGLLLMMLIVLFAGVFGTGAVRAIFIDMLYCKGEKPTTLYYKQA